LISFANSNLAPLILVTGATGAIGPRVVTALNAAGYRIRTLSLDAPATEMFPKSVQVQIDDVTNKSVVASTMQGVYAVIHLAALLHIFDPAPELRRKYERINVGGTKIIVAAAVRENVRRIVYFSTTAVYGNSNGRVLNEDTLPIPKTFYEQTKFEAERVVLAAKNQTGQPIGTVLRLASVYGSRIKGNYRQLLKALAKGRFIPLGNGQNRRTLIYDKDAANAALLALEHPAAAGKIFNVSDGEFHTLSDIIATIC
jgi:UDP-glucose 4-epimerase